MSHLPMRDPLKQTSLSHLCFITENPHRIPDKNPFSLSVMNVFNFFNLNLKTFIIL